MGDGRRRAVEAAKESKGKICPVCGKIYSERNKNRYRHFDRTNGAVTWCKAKTSSAESSEDGSE